MSNTLLIYNQLRASITNSALPASPTRELSA